MTCLSIFKNTEIDDELFNAGRQKVLSECVEAIINDYECDKLDSNSGTPKRMRSMND